METQVVMETASSISNVLHHAPRLVCTASVLRSSVRHLYDSSTMGGGIECPTNATTVGLSFVIQNTAMSVCSDTSFDVITWLKCKFWGPGTLCGLRGPYHSVGGPLHSIWGPVIWLLYSFVMLTIPQQYWKSAYVMKLQHTFKILQQRYFITATMLSKLRLASHQL